MGVLFDPPASSQDVRERAELGGLADEDERPRRRGPRPWWASSGPRLPAARHRWWADQCRAAVAAARAPSSDLDGDQGVERWPV
ncbi:hypothetical protein CcI49_06755 [Frankia sp. CcI49]|uniref:hypothetical protein n=1 Tax=Frankia sp. CcI49 TaxID=1745382 RepID=UPI0009787C4D|nr:hypothetical protein [Frankia sp. CcI49]ONH61283.1 hypothetical protein CcI49_06755 [Frankia sp. CcI49]